MNHDEFLEAAKTIFMETPNTILVEVFAYGPAIILEPVPSNSSKQLKSHTIFPHLLFFAI